MFRSNITSIRALDSAIIVMQNSMQHSKRVQMCHLLASAWIHWRHPTARQPIRRLNRRTDLQIHISPPVNRQARRSLCRPSHQTIRPFEHQFVRASFRPSDCPFTSLSDPTPARQPISSARRQVQEHMKGLKIDGNFVVPRGEFCPMDSVWGNSVRWEFHPRELCPGLSGRNRMIY